MIGAEIDERLVPPSEPPVPDAATKRLKTLGTLTAQAGALLTKRQASAGEMRAFADKMQNERAAAAESEDAARHDENALGQHGISKDYDQWLAVEVVAAADGRPRTRRRRRPARCAS